MQPGLGGALGDAQFVGYLGHGEVEVVAKDDGRPLLWFETPEASFELVAIGDPERGIGHRLGWANGSELGAPALLPARLLRTGIDRQPPHPGAEAVGIAQLRQSAPRLHEHFLHGIVSTIDIAQDETGEREEPVALGDGESLEGFVVAGLRRYDEVTLHVSLR